MESPTTVYALDLGGVTGTQTLTTYETMTVDSVITVGANGSLSLEGGTIAGTGDVNVNGAFLWTFGSLTTAGTMTIGSGASLTMSIPVAKVFQNGTINNSGSIVWTEGDINSDAGATLNNLAGGTIDVQGAFAFSRPCPQCFGRGQVIQTPCSTCRGKGVALRTSRFQVRIPKGIREGQRIRMAGQGAPGGSGGPRGDLYVEVHIAPDTRFARKGNDVYSDARINIVQAALGGRIPVQTIDGRVALKVPPGTHSGSLLRIRGKGVAPESGKRGDHYVRIRVETPTDLTPEQKEKLKEFARSAGLEI